MAEIKLCHVSRVEWHDHLEYEMLRQVVEAFYTLLRCPIKLVDQFQDKKRAKILALDVIALRSAICKWH